MRTWKNVLDSVVICGICITSCFKESNWQNSIKSGLGNISDKIVVSEFVKWRSQGRKKGKFVLNTIMIKYAVNALIGHLKPC